MLMKPSKVPCRKIERVYVLMGEYKYRPLLNLHIILHLIAMYGPMGQSRKQGCGNKIEKNGVIVTCQSEAGQTRCYPFICTGDDRGVYSDVSVSNHRQY